MRSLNSAAVFHVLCVSFVAAAPVYVDTVQACYDFVVIGAGTAGLPVAARLSETNASVLLIEAGGPPEDSGLPYRIPGLTGRLVGSPLDWNFTSFEPYLNNRTIVQNRGKALGGCSAINGMTMGVSSASVWDHTAALGNPGWGWEDNQEAFRKTFVFTPPPNNDSYRLYNDTLYPATGGPGKLGFNNYNLPVETDFVKAAAAIGIYPTVDILSGNQSGAQHEISTFDSESQLRVSSYDSFYQEAKDRSNFHVITYATGERVLFSNETGTPTVTGVMYQQYDKNGVLHHHNVTVSKEVILSAGVFQSPQLLMLSGIGPRETLEEHGIDVVVDNQAVGQGLQDQPWTSLVVRTNQSGSTMKLFRPDLFPEYAATAEADFAANESGPYDSISGTTGPTHLFLSFTREELESVNATHLLQSNRTTQSHLEIIFFSHPYPNTSTPYYALDPKLNYFSLTGWILAPKSKGFMTIQSANVADAPILQHNTLMEDTDVKMCLLAIRKMRAMLADTNLSHYTVGGHNGEVIPGAHGQTDDDLEKYFRSNVASAAHQVGTVIMLPREDGGVVDSRLRVYGVSGLRVADVSVLPIMPDNHPSGSAYMIGEKAAEFLKADNGL